MWNEKKVNGIHVTTTGNAYSKGITVSGLMARLNPFEEYDPYVVGNKLVDGINKGVEPMLKTSVTLSDGMVLTGTRDQVERAAKNLGYNLSGMYFSSSTNSYMPITSMDTTHLRNAIHKIHREWVDSLNGLSARDYVKAMSAGPTTANFTNLYNELRKRVGNL